MKKLFFAFLLLLSVHQNDGAWYSHFLPKIALWHYFQPQQWRIFSSLKTIALYFVSKKQQVNMTNQTNADTVSLPPVVESQKTFSGKPHVLPEKISNTATIKNNETKQTKKAKIQTIDDLYKALLEKLRAKNNPTQLLLDNIHLLKTLPEFTEVGTETDNRARRLNQITEYNSKGETIRDLWLPNLQMNRNIKIHTDEPFYIYFLASSSSAKTPLFMQISLVSYQNYKRTELGSISNTRIAIAPEQWQEWSKGIHKELNPSNSEKNRFFEEYDTQQSIKLN